ncbi:MAG: thiamine pyrophosphate-binding protein [Dehalococcoidia bacterium]|nr:thiamine pyrophosphate-binding protein [Dehalococcoidia bacterium]
MKIDGGEMFARMLKREGVENIFGLHGGHIDPIFQACMDHQIRLVDTRHEQAAGHMADAWARTTGKPGVAVVTAGPGVTDIVTAVANAYMDCVPMIVAGGRHPLSEDEQMPLQELHGLPLMQSITKWSRLVRDTERIPEYVSMAFRQATTGRPGPVFLEIPADVLARRVDEEQVRYPATSSPEAPPAPQPEALSRALDMLAKAERPVILAGRGVWFAGAAAELREFAEATGIPVCANGMTRGAVPEDTPLGLGGFMVAGRALAFAGGPDVVLLLGARLGLFTGGRQSIIPPGAKVIQVDIEGTEIGRSRDIDLGIVADAREALRALIAAARGRSFPARDEWVGRIRQAQAGIGAMYAAALDPARRPVHPFRLAKLVAEAMSDGVLAVDGGETFVWAEMAIAPRRPGRYLGHGYLGCLGTGIPFGLAAKLAHPEERVLVLTGDGSVGLNFAEFDTAVRHNLPVVVVVNNDQAWGMCKHEQVVRLGEDRITGTELGLVRYDKAAAAFGVHAEFVEDGDGILPAIERAFASGRPACVNVMTDPDAISPAVQAAARVEAPAL